MLGSLDEAENIAGNESSNHNEPVEQSTAHGGDDMDNDTSKIDGETKEADAGTDAAEEDGAVIDKKRPHEENADLNDEPMPTLPLKKARTAYFIFADEKREGLKELVRMMHALS